MARAELTLDPSFGTGGYVHTAFGPQYDAPRDLLILPDGRIVAAGTSLETDSGIHIAMARYSANGVLDTLGFGSAGKVRVRFDYRDYANAIGLQGDGSLVVAGMQMHTNFGSSQIPAVYRFTPNGEVDSGFGVGGTWVSRYDENSTGEHSDLAILADGRIVAAGCSNSSANGGIQGFARKLHATDGTQIGADRIEHNMLTDRGSAAFTPDGGYVGMNTIVLNGHVEFFLGKMTGAGQPDLSFGPGGFRTTGCEIKNGYDYKVMILPSGKILVGATSPKNTFFEKISLFRFSADGVIDPGFGTGGRVDLVYATSNDIFHDMTVDAFGNVIVVGESRSGFLRSLVVRLLPDGVPDESFAPGGGQVLDLDSASSLITQGAIQPDGRIIVAGSDYNDFVLARFNAPVTGVADIERPQPIPVALFPNPVRRTAMIEFRLAEPGNVTMALFDGAGRKVRSLLTGALPAGSHEFRWDGRDDSGLETPDGVYFLKLLTPGAGTTRKLIRLQ
ncbi:MAG TPA: FlgD immunoglobulin-like domain containing protein [Candidatus Eisenbacteria bacterium]